MNELKPCPFCGDQEAEKAHDDGLFWIRCKSCGATGPANTRYSGEEGEPFTDWNTRAIPDTHRVVSVELLENIAQTLGKCGYFHGDIRAIIDNKEQKE